MLTYDMLIIVRVFTVGSVHRTQFRKIGSVRFSVSESSASCRLTRDWSRVIATGQSDCGFQIPAHTKHNMAAENEMANEQVVLQKPPSSFRSGVWTYFGFRSLTYKSRSTCNICSMDVSYKAGNTSTLTWNVGIISNARKIKEKKKLESSGKSTSLTQVRKSSMSGQLRWIGPIEYINQSRTKSSPSKETHECHRYVHSMTCDHTVWRKMQGS